MLFIDRSPIPLPGEQAAASTDPNAAPAAVNTGMITFEVPPEAALVLASVPADSFYLTLLPNEYTPRAIGVFDATSPTLPGEDPGLLTPYGPSGLPADSNP